jgi:CDP-glucose 4,6-dehydratase
MGLWPSPLEGVVNMSFWKGKKVFITGHTGFKGSWLSLWLQRMGAVVTGYALAPPSEPNMFTLAKVIEGMVSIKGDIRDYERLKFAIAECQPDVVFHLAAQALVRKSYQTPLETLTTNIIGTANLLEAARFISKVRAIVNVTSDKCYSNQEWIWGYRETDGLGGHDPYSCSKGCSELVTDAYIKSFCSEKDSVTISSARAGNVIGGGDWGEDRLVPDIIRAIINNQPVSIRHPDAIRPWQHVLEPLNGYLLLAEKCFTEGHSFSGPWNFGPNYENDLPVSALADVIIKSWNYEKGWFFERTDELHEANYLRLDSSKAKRVLGWQPVFDFKDTVQLTTEWYKAYMEKSDLYQQTIEQIELFEKKRMM